ncbi:S1C family serine protease [Pseudonocardia sp. RS010]|uniref:S1C family serine protease n=1 Tax=Pseudonocardia sp. RS010 TaxID=3385979 RepID=UPI0039A276F2
MPSRASRVRVALPAVLAAVLALGACTATAPPATTAAPSAPSRPLATGLADVVARLEPSVVTVRVGSGLGSGVVYRPDVVLTNQHVVADLTNGAEVGIDFADGTSTTGTLIATDRSTDLAVIRSDRGDLPVPTYRPELPRPGDAVLAIGSPLGLENTVTFGIVSAVGRQVPGSATQGRALVDLIQVDAAISPGNSGGALIDASGQVIGINEAYLPPQTGAVSLGFAIPAATATSVADQLLEKGFATHPYLGVSLGRLTDDIRQALGVPAPQGALVLAVDPQGPAAAAGVRAGDVITGFAGQPVDTVEDLLGGLRRTDPGQQVPMTVARGTDTVSPTVTIGSTGE